MSRPLGGAVDDAELLGHINRLAQEEHRLFEQRSHTRVAAERERLREIELMLDQCWDLLRQRRVRRAAGLDPDEARARDLRTVEGYSG